MASWKVWDELARRTHIELIWGLLVGRQAQIEDVGDGRREITLDVRLRRADRRAALAHELVHDERGVFFTDATPIEIVRKEEAYVEAEAVRRLVPLDELDGIVRSTVLDGGVVTVEDVCAWFDVPADVARAAMLQLKQRSRRRHPASQPDREQPLQAALDRPERWAS